MICCCAHFVGLHAAPASENEPPGKCSKPGCECGLFEPDPQASTKPPVPESARPLGVCGCREITFVDGRQGQQNCAQHCYEGLANGFQNIANILANLGINFRRLSELEAGKTAARVKRENDLLLSQPPPGARRIS